MACAESIAGSAPPTRDRDPRGEATALGRCLALLLLLGCAPDTPARPGRLRVVQWNVENLFDAQDDPDNEGDDDFTPAGWRHWSGDRYLRKIDHLAAILADLDGDIVCLQEVENRQVLEDLTLVLRQTHGLRYRYIVHRDGPDHRGVDVAMLSQFAPSDTHWLTPVEEQRDVLRVRLAPHGVPLVVFVVHWKSRWGGQRATEPLRIRQARATREAVDRELQRDPQAAVMVVGDFNDGPAAPSVSETLHSVTNRALLAAGGAGSALFNLHGTLPGDARGTLYYRKGKTWNAFDQVLVSPSMMQPDVNGGWKVRAGSYKVYAPDILRIEDGTPHSFRIVYDRKAERHRYQEGYSDHFPVVVELERE